MFVVFLSCFLVLCSSDVELRSLSSYVTGQNSSGDTDDDTDEEEDDIIAIPPTDITGTYLVCQPGQKEEDKIFISCYLEQQGELFTEVPLSAKHFSVKNDNGGDLMQGFSQISEGIYSIELSSNIKSNINISLINIESLLGEQVQQADSYRTVITEEEMLGEVNQTDLVFQKSSDLIKKAENSSQDPSSENLGEDKTISEDSLAQSEVDCRTILPSGSWVLVPGDSFYNTTDFCVMKYEAKCSEQDGQFCSILEHLPFSNYENTPWVNINRDDAKSACKSLGDKYHLITNNEWMTIGKNIVNLALNWSSNIIGTGELARGHSDSDPFQACYASSSEENAYVDGTCEGSSLGPFNQRRTHILSNGETIWDLSGNVWEWIDFFDDFSKPSPLGNNWFEISSVTSSIGLSLSDLIPESAITNSWNSLHSIGQYYPGSEQNGRTMLRGGDWFHEAYAGLFAARLDSPPITSLTDLGFRCVFDLSGSP